MHKIFAVLLAVIALIGCAKTISPYGNHLTGMPSEIQVQLATFAVNQLVNLYPPGRSRFEIQQPTPDQFGQLLVKGLRDNGYAVQEFEPIQDNTTPADTKAAAGGEPASAPGASQSYPLRYVVDQAGYSDLYGLNLLVGDQSLAISYQYNNGELWHGGYWTRGH